SPSLPQRLDQAYALARQGRLTDALALLDGAAGPDRAAVQPLQVDLLKALGRLDEALVIRRAQARAEPGGVASQHNLASLLGDLGRNVEAVEAARRALGNGGQAPETWLVLARALAAQFQHAEAMQAFEQALRRRPAYVEAARE